MVAEVAGVVAGAVDESSTCGGAGTACRSGTGPATSTTPPSWRIIALAVEHRHVEPGVVGAEAGRPDDRPDLAAAEVEAEARRLRRPRSAAKRCGGGDRRRRGRSPSPTRRSCRAAGSILRSASSHMLRSEPENWALPSLMPASRPTSFTPMSVSALRSSVAALGRAGELQRRHAARPHDVVDLVVALVEHAGGVHPPLDVPAAVDAGRPHVLADRQRHRTARALDLVGDLDAGRRRADDQHAAVGELVRVAVLLGVSVADRRRHGCRRTPGTRGDVARARREHDGPAVPVALVGRDQVAVVGARAPTSPSCRSAPGPRSRFA